MIRPTKHSIISFRLAIVDDFKATAAANWFVPAIRNFTTHAKVKLWESPGKAGGLPLINLT
jgi:hypothetical protein